MKFDNEKLDIHFEIPEPVTERALLKYESVRDELGLAGASLYERLWEAARTIITGWSCPACALDYDLGGTADPKAGEVIRWVGLSVFTYVLGLRSVPKNS